MPPLTNLKVAREFWSRSGPSGNFTMLSQLSSTAQQPSSEIQSDIGPPIARSSFAAHFTS